MPWGYRRPMAVALLDSLPVRLLLAAYLLGLAALGWIRRHLEATAYLGILAVCVGYVQWHLLAAWLEGRL